MARLAAIVGFNRSVVCSMSSLKRDPEQDRQLRGPATEPLRDGQHLGPQLRDVHHRQLAWAMLRPRLAVRRTRSCRACASTCAEISSMSGRAFPASAGAPNERPHRERTCRQRQIKRAPQRGARRPGRHSRRAPRGRREGTRHECLRGSGTWPICDRARTPHRHSSCSDYSPRHPLRPSALWHGITALNKPSAREDKPQIAPLGPGQVSRRWVISSRRRWRG